MSLFSRSFRVLYRNIRTSPFSYSTRVQNTPAIRYPIRRYSHTFPPEQLLQALELTANTPLPSIPHGQDQEYFWRAHLLANQIIMYLAARPPTEAQSFAAIFQNATVPSTSDIAKGRAGVLKITKTLVNTMSDVPPDSSLRAHSNVFEAFDALSAVYHAYEAETGDSNKHLDMETWTRFFVGLRTELVEFTVRIGQVIDKWETETGQEQK